MVLTALFGGMGKGNHTTHETAAFYSLSLSLSLLHGFGSWSQNWEESG